MSVSQTSNQMQKLDAERVKQSNVVRHVIAPALKGKTGDPDLRRCREITSSEVLEFLHEPPHEEYLYRPIHGLF